MSAKELKTVIAFYTTADAMETEDILTSNGISGKLIPVPREISAGCGIAWAMPVDDYKNIPQNIRAILPTPEQIAEIMC